MIQRCSRSLALTVAFLLATASLAVETKRTDWSGRDVDNKNIFWTCSNVGRDKWVLKKNGKQFNTYEGVTSTSEFIELQLKGVKRFARLRLYKDRMSINKEGSKTEWTTMAKGKWTK